MAALNLKQHLQRCLSCQLFSIWLVVGKIKKAIVQKLLHPRNFSTKHLLPILQNWKNIIQLLVVIMFDGDLMWCKWCFLCAINCAIGHYKVKIYHLEACKNLCWHELSIEEVQNQVEKYIEWEMTFETCNTYYNIFPLKGNIPI